MTSPPSKVHAVVLTNDGYAIIQIRGVYATAELAEEAKDTIYNKTKDKNAYLKVITLDVKTTVPKRDDIVKIKKPRRKRNADGAVINHAERNETRADSPEESAVEDSDGDGVVVSESDGETEMELVTRPTKKRKLDVPEVIAKGKPGCLEHCKLFFTGTFADNRKDIEQNAKALGAKIVTRMNQADYIILGTKPGPKKLTEIAQKEYATKTEAQYLAMIGAD